MGDDSILFILHIIMYIIQVKLMKEDEYIQRIEKRLEFEAIHKACYLSET